MAQPLTTEEQQRTDHWNKIRELVEKNDPESKKLAGELADDYARRYGIDPPPQQREPTYAEGVSRRFGELDARGILSKFPEEFSRRRETLMQGYSGPAPISTLGVGASQIARTGGELALGTLNLILPDFVREGAEEGWEQIKDEPWVQTAGNAAGRGYEYYKKWKNNNPREAELFETSVDVAFLFTPSRKIEATPFKDKATKAYNNAVYEEKRAGVDALLEPFFDNERGFYGRWVEGDGFLRKKVYVPSPKEEAIRETLTDIDRIDPNRSFGKNHNVVEDQISIESKELTALILRAGNPTFVLDEFTGRLTQTLLDFESGNVPAFNNLTEAAQTKTKFYLKEAERILRNQVKGEAPGGESNALNLLAARRQFDKNLREGADVFGSDVESAKAVAGRIVRDMLNDKLKEITPGEQAAEKLQRMHHLYEAKDLLERRKTGEAKNALLRTWDTIADRANLPKTPLALYTTLKLTGAGAAGAVTGALAGGAVAEITVLGGLTGAALYGAIKIASKKNQLRLLASVLSGIDKAKRAYKDDRNLTRQLIADRAVIVELMDELRTEPEEDEDAAG